MSKKLDNGFVLKNDEKVERALAEVSDGSGEYEESALIAEYDKLGGLIERAGHKVKTGSFYDFKNKKALKEPSVVFIFNVNGEIVEVEDGEELPGEVKASLNTKKAKALSKVKAKVEEESDEVEEDEADEEVEAKPAKTSRRGKK